MSHLFLQLQSHLGEFFGWAARAYRGARCSACSPGTVAPTSHEHLLRLAGRACCQAVPGHMRSCEQAAWAGMVHSAALDLQLSS